MPSKCGLRPFLLESPNAELPRTLLLGTRVNKGRSGTLPKWAGAL